MLCSGREEVASRRELNGYYRARVAFENGNFLARGKVPQPNG